VKRQLGDKGLTPFQKKVLMATAAIPPGTVRTYRWVAARINNPRACRAVGQALKRNPLPVIIPCHRVVRNDYRIGGFSRGIAAKKRLLADEGLTIRGDTVIIGSTQGDQNDTRNKSRSR
jgi:O-6-methylguanine DNA methyltransferase